MLASLRPRARRSAYGAAVLLVVGCFSGCGSPPPDRRVAAAGGGGTDERSFTLPGSSSEERHDFVLNADAELSGDTEPAFDAMTDEVDRAYPDLLTFGGAPSASPGQDGMRWVMCTEEPTPAQIDLLATYPGTLHVYYGNAPTPKSLRHFAGDLWLEFDREGGPLQFMRFEFNDDRTGLEVYYSAPAGLSASDIQARARALVARAIERVGDPEFDLDFLEQAEPAVAD
jgi:hypothetical protein